MGILGWQGRRGKINGYLGAIKLEKNGNLKDGQK